ncbi:MAG TPA: DUF4268 domain-containing protein [Paludibacter sp.]|nr:DUF4268 domain-containing protein [Prolixibacteraceae bacterium]
MFTKEEKEAHVQRFWSQFDDYCDTIPELAWRKKKWILHDTKISHIDLKFYVDNDLAMVALEINHRSEDRRLRVYELVERYRILLEEGFTGGLTWNYCYLNANMQEVCRIYIEKRGVDLYQISDWPVIYQFLAENMLQLQDNFVEIQEVLKEEVNILHREE